MVSTFVVIIAVVTGIVAGWAANDLRHRFKDVKDRLAKLENAQSKHLTYDRLEQIEAAASAIIALKRESDLYQDFIDNALTHIGRAREDKRK